MIAIRRVAATAAALVTGASGVLLAAGTAPSGAAPAASVPGCHAVDLSVTLGGLDAGAGQRYQDVRIANVSDHDCRLTGYPRFRFVSHGTPVGVRSQPQGMATATVLLQVGDSAWSTLHFVDPGPVPTSDCQAADATVLRMRLPDRPHLYRLGMAASVCTTAQYAPIAYPVRDRQSA